MFPRKRPLRRFEKRHQQGILALAQRNRCLIGSHEPSAATLEPPTTESVAALPWIAGSGDTRHPSSAQNGTSTCEQFPGAEGLGEIVIGAELEANDTINFIGLVASHDNGNI